MSSSLQDIDFKLLKEQRLTITNLITSNLFSDQIIEHLEGILELLHCLTDEHEESGGAE